jgi:hypothetical protein
VSIAPRFERAVIAEFLLRERQAMIRRRNDRDEARMLAERLHRGNDDLLSHLGRVALVVPPQCRAVAWLHHAHEADVTRPALHVARLTAVEVEAIELLASLSGDQLHRARALSAAPGAVGDFARVVARAELEDKLRGRRPDSEDRSASPLPYGELSA